MYNGQNLPEHYSDEIILEKPVNSKFKNFFRWVGILPAALIGLIVSFILAKMFLSLPWWIIGINSTAPLFKIIEIVASGISGYFFVYGGAKIAPSHKKEIIYGLTGLAILLGGMSLFDLLARQLYFDSAKAIAAAIGSMALLYLFNSGEDVFN